MEFAASASYTVGAEWELQLLDADTLDLSPGINTVISAFSGNIHVKPELVQSCVELNTPVAKDSAEIESFLLKLTSDVLRTCRAHGMGLAGSGTHPFCRRLALITPLPRYETLARAKGYLAQTQLAFATHVHVGVATGDQAIRAMRYLTPALPLLIAVAANSPLWRGHETGYASYRRRLLSALRSYGLPPYFEDWQDFVCFYQMACRAGSIQSIKDIHWDIRPHPDFGTVECRVMDSQSTVSDVAYLAGMVRVLVAWICSSGQEQIEAVLPRRLSSWIDRENHFRASHWGMEARLIHDECGETRPVTTYLKNLAKAVSHVADELGERRVVSRLADSSTRTSGYRWQRSVHKKNSSPIDVAKSLRDILCTECLASGHSVLSD